MKTNLLLELALSVFFSGALNAGHYINPSAQSVSQIPPPPANGSNADKLDLAALHEWQEKRTPAECERAKSETNASYEEVFGTVSPFPKPIPKKAAAILAGIKADTDAAVVVLKDHYARRRPFKRDPSLHPCIDPALGKIGAFAYPSGHTTITRVFALLLSELVPAEKEIFMAKADDAARNRIVAGVHHPSDIDAGKRLADGLYAQFKKVPAFKQDIGRLRALLLKKSAAAP
ncbi:MAG: phosphatase PAP2 family protein [Elusimicrobiales bacterium]|jgi:acid phosphatase (class A)